MQTARPIRTGVATSAGGRISTTSRGSAPIPTNLYQVQEGRYTQTIYNLLADGKLTDIVRILNTELHSRPRSRAALSLLGYCYFQLQDFTNAVHCYEKLVEFFPDVDDYKLYYAQALYKASQFDLALTACAAITKPEHTVQAKKLQAAIRYQLNDVNGCRALVELGRADDLDTLINQGCLLFKEQKYEDAVAKFSDALKRGGYTHELTYYVALCQYVQQLYIPALKTLTEIIERAVHEHPELNIGLGTADPSVPRIANSLALSSSFIIEAFNLKAAIEFQLKNYHAAKEALHDMPPRNEIDLDPVTLHNIALINMDSEPTKGFEKLNYLLQANPCPPETLGNLLLLYIKHDFDDIAADLLAQCQHFAHELIDPFVKRFIEAVLLRKSSVEDSFKKLDEMGNEIIEDLRKLTKCVQEARQSRDDETIKRAVMEYDECIDLFVPVVMAQAKLYWDMNKYDKVEQVFRKSMEFCSEHEQWALNVAHVLFMQESKYKEAIACYEPIVRKSYDTILEVPAIVLANLCVAYIMTNQNELAEEVMRRIEREEERVNADDPSRQTLHLCIVNLVIGTLYCAKGNYEFGISRVIKSIDPVKKKLSTDTWFYAKRCFVALFEILAKQMLILKDATLKEIADFLDECALHGKSILASLDVERPDLQSQSTAAWTKPGFGGDARAESEKLKNNVAFEARYLKSLYLRL